MYDKELNDSIDNNGSEPVQAGSPGWFQGTGAELGRAVNNIGVTFNRVSARAGEASLNVSSALAASQGQPEYAQKLHEMAPVDETKLAKYEKPDALNSGKAAIMLGDLFQQVPTIAASLVNPAAGFTVGAAAGNEEGLSKAQDMGVTGPAAKQFAALNALESGIGGALPGVGGVGENALLKYGSRFVVGGLINTATSEAGAYSRAAVLDSYGFTQQANQLRQWDTQAALTQFVLGGFFNLGGGHVRDRGSVEVAPGVRENINVGEGQGGAVDSSAGTENSQFNMLRQDHADASTHTAVQDNYVTESAPGLAADAHTEAAHVKSMDAAADAVHTGRAVDVSEHFADDHTFVVHGDIDAGVKERQTFGEAGVAKTDAIVNAAKEQGMPEPVKPSEPQPGQIDANIEQPFDIVRAQIEGLRETHPELAEALAPHIDTIQAEHAVAHMEADQYNVAAACAISFGA